MNTYEISLELPNGKYINIVVAAPTMGDAERDAQAAIRHIQEETILSGRTFELGTNFTHAVEIKEIWLAA